MRAIVMWVGIAALYTMGMPAAGAADKPDTLASFKKYPMFARIIKETRLSDDDVNVTIRMCRGASRTCEMFVADGDDLQALTDYAYLFAVYKGGYDKGKPASLNGQALVEEAKAQGYGEALLSSYETKYPCHDTKDAIACVMHGIRQDISLQRQIYVDDGSGDFKIVEANEDGSTDFGY